MFIVTGEPTQAVLDAVGARLKADTALTALVGGRVYGHVTEAARATLPYLVLGRTSLNRDSGAMQLPGARVTLTIDGWSDYKGPYEMNRILSCVSALFERQPIRVAGFAVVDGSMTCELSTVFDEPDDDAPQKRLYHGVQRWVLDVHEAT